MSSPYIKIWLEIGKQNQWISNASDPPFDENSFYECKIIDELIDNFRHGNWCLGQAFYYKDLCFINQVNGGDEWLTIRRDIPFDSISCGYIIEHDGEEEFRKLIDRIMKATDEQLRNLEY